MLFKLFKVIDYIVNLSTIDVDIFLLQKPRRIPNVFILYILGRQKQSILKSFFLFIILLPNISVFLQEHSTNSYQKLIFNVYSKQSNGKEAGKYKLNVWNLVKTFSISESFDQKFCSQCLFQIYLFLCIAFTLICQNIVFAEI